MKYGKREVIRQRGRDGQDIELDNTRWCRVCGLGSYQLIINEFNK